MPKETVLISPSSMPSRTISHAQLTRPGQAGQGVRHKPRRPGYRVGPIVSPRICRVRTCPVYGATRVRGISWPLPVPYGCNASRAWQMQIVAEESRAQGPLFTAHATRFASRTARHLLHARLRYLSTPTRSGLDKRIVNMTPIQLSCPPQHMQRALKSKASSSLSMYLPSGHCQFRVHLPRP